MVLIDGGFRFVITKAGDLSFTVDLKGYPSQYIRIPTEQAEPFYNFVRAIVQLRDAGMGLSPGREITGTDTDAVNAETRANAENPGEGGE